MGFVIDSNSPYIAEFSPDRYKDAVYMTAEDDMYGTLLAIVYKVDQHAPKLSVVLIGAHGTSGFLSMTLDKSSRYFCACRGLAPTHYSSPVRRSLAIASLRTSVTMDKPLKRRFDAVFDEASAGSLGSRFRLLCGKFPQDIGERVVRAGLICPKTIRSSAIDIVYEDSDKTIDQNDELIYLLGEQLEQLFDPLTQYYPEQTDRLYNPLGALGFEAVAANSNQGPDSAPPVAANEPKPPESGHTGRAPLGQQPSDLPGEVPSSAQSDTPPDAKTDSAPATALAGAQPGVGAASSVNPQFPTLDDEPQDIQDICEELYLLESQTRNSVLELLQRIVIPLRVQALEGQIEGLTVAKLNTIFPPTIDEVFRVHCIFYDALKTALPYGAFEIMRACGTTIPYFYRACIRHLAATKYFEEFLREMLAEMPNIASALEIDILAELPNIVSVVRDCCHLETVRSLLKTLADSREWDPSSQPLVDEFLQISCNTIGGISVVTADNGIENTLGVLLKEWPSALDKANETRRVITVFEVEDILEPSVDLQSLHLIFMIFSDGIIICRPTEPLPQVSPSGLHIPQFTDMLLHSMLNGAPLDKSIPPFDFVAGLSLADTHFASYGDGKLHVFSPQFVRSFEIVTSGAEVEDLVHLLAKAKITNKAQPFHLFSLKNPGYKELQLLGAVQEMSFYSAERSRSKVAIVLNSKLKGAFLYQYDLFGVISLDLHEKTGMVTVNTLTTGQYSLKKEVSKEKLQDFILRECAYLLTLSLSSQNEKLLNPIIKSNSLISSELVQWANIAPPKEREVKSVAAPTNRQSQATHQTDDDGRAQFDNWFHQLRQRRRDDDSLSSDSISGDRFSSNFSIRADRSNQDLQIGSFLDPSWSSVYNLNAGQAFPRLDSRQSDSSNEDDQASAAESKRVALERSNTLTLADAGPESSVPREDFGYLATLVNTSGNVSRSSSLASARARSPGLRERSLIKMGQYVIDGSLKKLAKSSSVRTFSSGESTSTGATPSEHFGSFRSLRSRRFQSSNVIDDPLIEVDEEALEHENAVLARDWLAWTASNQQMTALENPDIPARSQSHSSFRKMVMSSSLHTLQLASYVIQIEQRIASSDAPVAGELGRVKNDLTRIFKMDSSDEAVMRSATRRMCGIYYLLTQLGCEKLALGLLEIEWTRRSRVSAENPELAKKMWGLNIAQ